MLSLLNNDCICEIASYLDFRNWHKFKNTSNIVNNIVYDKNNIKSCYNGTWGCTKINGKEYQNHYFGGVIKSKKKLKKSQDGYVKHGIGIFTKQIGKYTYEIYRGLFFNNILQSNHYTSYVRKEFTYSNGPYK